MSSIATQPRTLVVIQLVNVNGTKFTPIANGRYEVVPTDVHFERNAHGSVDTATIVLPLKSVDPTRPVVDLSAQIKPGIQARASVYAGYPANPQPGSYGIDQLSLRFVGMVNQLDVDVDVHHATMTLTCRSLGSILVDTKMTTNLLHGTTEDFVKKWCAGQHGMNVVYQLPTGAKPTTMSEVFKRYQVVGLKNMKQWDILMLCAQADNVNVWVDDTSSNYLGDDNEASNSSWGTLYYVSQDTLKRATFTVDAQADLLTFKGTHSPQFNKNIEVRVHNWSPKTRTSTTRRTVTNFDGSTSTTTHTRTVVSVEGFGTPTITSQILSNGSSATVNSTITGGSHTATSSLSSGGGTKEVYNYWYTGQTQDFLDKEVVRLWREISQHEYSIEITMPMTPDLLSVFDLTTLIKIQNSLVPSWNSTYHLRRYTETFNMTAGWTVQFTGVNHQLPSDNQAAV